MYVGTHYNSYYNSLFPNSSSVYGSFSKTSKTNNFNAFTNSLTNTSGAKYVQDLKSGASDLSKALAALTSGKAFKQTAAVSANSKAMTVNSTGSTAANLNLGVQINQVASGQVNSGKALNSKASSALSGYQQFSIETNGRTYQFSINVNAGESNKSVQEKMAAAINLRGIGINASITTDSASGTSSLSLSAESTGDNAKSKFVIQDVYGSAVAQTGAGQVSQQAQNAVYSVNGGAAKTSQTNTVDLGNGITATLLQATETEVKVTRGVDKEYATNQVKDMVAAYNKLYGAALNNETDSKANNLLTQLSNNSRTYASSLAKVGIGFDASGYMKVDADKLAKAAENGSLEKFFTENQNTNYGFTNQLAKTANNVSNNTARYVSSSSIGSSQLDNFYNYFNNDFFSNYQNYFSTNGAFNSGMLFDLLL